MILQTGRCIGCSRLWLVLMASHLQTLLFWKVPGEDVEELLMAGRSVSGIELQRDVNRPCGILFLFSVIVLIVISAKGSIISQRG